MTTATKPPVPSSKPEADEVWINVALPKAVHKKLRLKAVNDEVQLKDVVRDALVAFLK